MKTNCRQQEGSDPWIQPCRTCPPCWKCCYAAAIIWLSLLRSCCLPSPIQTRPKEQQSLSGSHNGRNLTSSSDGRQVQEPVPFPLPRRRRPQGLLTVWHEGCWDRLKITVASPDLAKLMLLLLASSRLLLGFASQPPWRLSLSAETLFLDVTPTVQTA